MPNRVESVADARCGGVEDMGLLGLQRNVSCDDVSSDAPSGDSFRLESSAAVENLG